MQKKEKENIIPTIFVEKFFQILTVLVFFIGLINNMVGLVVLSFSILVLVNGAKIWSRMSLKKVKCKINIDTSKVFPGDKINVELKVDNEKALPIWLQLQLPISNKLTSDLKGEFVTEEGNLLWYQSLINNWSFTAQKRGCYIVGPLNLIAGDLLGFFNKQKVYDDVHGVIVYSRLVPLRGLKPFYMDFFGDQKIKSPVEDPLLMVGTRDYQLGRPARYIHWKASARYNKLQEKIFEASSQLKMLLLIDVEDYAINNSETEFEQMLEVAASMTVHFLEKGIPVGLLINGILVDSNLPFIPVNRNSKQEKIILETLARIEMKKDPNKEIGKTLARNPGLLTGTTCFVFSYEKNEKIIGLKKLLEQIYKTPTVLILNKAANSEIGNKFYLLGEIHGSGGVSVEE